MYRPSGHQTLSGGPLLSRTALPLDLTAMRQQLGDDDELMSDVIALFLDDYPRRVDALNRALAARQAGDVRAIAHALKGGAGNLCAFRVVEAARALEAACEGGDFTMIRGHVEQLVADLEQLSAALLAVQAGKLRQRSETS